MQKAQSFEQPRDYISMPKQKYKPKFDIGKARNYMPEIDKNEKKPKEINNEPKYYSYSSRNNNIQLNQNNYV